MSHGFMAGHPSDGIKTTQIKILLLDTHPLVYGGDWCGGPITTCPAPRLFFTCDGSRYTATGSRGFMFERSKISCVFCRVLSRDDGERNFVGVGVGSSGNWNRKQKTRVNDPTTHVSYDIYQYVQHFWRFSLVFFFGQIDTINLNLLSNVSCVHFFLSFIY